ncbi:hypothetical protein B7486_77835, partial [cyanobacterium TDX16]
HRSCRTPVTATTHGHGTPSAVPASRVTPEGGVEPRCRWGGHPARARAGPRGCAPPRAPRPSARPGGRRAGGRTAGRGRPAPPAPPGDPTT